MLIVNRYIDADKIFYDEAEEYMDTLIRVNERLSMWEHKPNWVEDYLSRVEEHANLTMGQFKKLIIKHKKKIEKIL